jgi:hypothetical protein
VSASPANGSIRTASLALVERSLSVLDRQRGDLLVVAVKCLGLNRA